MQSVWVVGNASQIKSIPLEESEGYFTYGASVYGNETHDPSVNHFFPDHSRGCPASNDTQSRDDRQSKLLS